MRQDWVTEVLQDLPSLNWALFVIMPSFELSLTVQERSFEEFEPLFNPKAACLSLQRRCEVPSSSMGPDPDGSGPFWPTLQRIGPKHPKTIAMESLISGPGYNSQLNKTSLSYLSVKSLFINPEWFRPFEKPFFMRRTLWHPYHWAVFISECHWCKIVSDSSYTKNVFFCPFC